MTYLVRYFVRGLVIAVPAAVTIWILYQSFIWLDQLLPFDIPGLGALVVVLGLILIGVLASNIITRKAFELTERLFVRAPIARIVYLAIRDLVEAFVGERKRFNQPVLVRLPELSGASAIGFLTRDTIPWQGSDDMVAVYFPQSYNFAGNLLLVPKSAVTPLAGDPSQIMAFIVSGGVSGEPGTSGI